MAHFIRILFSYWPLNCIYKHWILLDIGYYLLHLKIL